MSTEHDPAMIAKAQRACRLMAERMASLTPAQRDRLLQEHMAAALSPRQRAAAWAELTELATGLQRAKR